ncbi:5-formyltetrahydrofolate cyclo-ligase [Helicobacter sp.]|uniref:5-formyltetrahydrofolate cyclo-ligase n=1 Tax=Helicobacter sp. TaxID=218 RepID=UPI001994B4D4|nr:5-formyltetrahydrofolate cyclo-ligase [Helicobacter sp.]MBD5165935.1 5-formyltetrahydrofolate cyclo-ligase [Helicobacter sp.]
MQSQGLKATYRKTFKANLIKTRMRKNLYGLDSRIQKQLKAHLQCYIQSHKKHSKYPINLLFYSPLPLEFDIRKLLRFYRKTKRVRVFLPFMHEESFKAVPYRLPLQKKSFGVFEPSDSSYHATIDCAIVPVLGVDKELRRIGFGKGMYDRFFAPYQASRKTPKILFVCRNFNYASEVITQDYDIRGDVLITPLYALSHQSNARHSLKTK